MLEDGQHDNSMASFVKAMLDEPRDDKNSTVFLEDQPETNDEAFTSPGRRQHDKLSRQQKEKRETCRQIAEETSDVNCERIGFPIVCKDDEGITSSLQISVEDIEQLQRANRTEIDFNNQYLHETLRVVLRNAKAEKFNTDFRVRETECMKIEEDGLGIKKTDSNSTLQKHKLQEKCRSSERHSQHPNLEKEIKEEADRVEGDENQYQDVECEEIDGHELCENSNGITQHCHSLHLQTLNELEACLDDASSQESSVQVTDDCGNAKENNNYLEPNEPSVDPSARACSSTHEQESNQGMEMSGEDTHDTLHSGLCSENDEEESQPDTLESYVTVSGDELTVNDSSHHETSADKSLTPPEKGQHDILSGQQSGKGETDGEMGKEADLNHCDRIGVASECEDSEGVTPSLQVSAEDIEQLQGANRTEIDYDNQSLHESLHVVLTNAEAEKFHTEYGEREMECEIAEDDVKTNKTDKSPTPPEKGQHDVLSRQQSGKKETDGEMGKEADQNHCDRIGVPSECEDSEGVTPSLQVSAEDIEQLQGANRTEIDYDNQSLHESLHVVLTNAEAEKFHTEYGEREMECEIAEDDVKINKTDSNSTLQEHRLQDICRSSERHLQKPSLERAIKEPNEGEGDPALYQDLQCKGLDGPALCQDSNGVELPCHKSAENSPHFQMPNESEVFVDDTNSQEIFVQVTDDCGSEKEESNYFRPVSGKTCLSTHEHDCNQGIEMSRADTDTLHSGLCSENDGEENQPDSTESAHRQAQLQSCSNLDGSPRSLVTVSGDKRPTSCSSLAPHETSAGADEDDNSDCQKFMGRCQTSGAKSPVAAEIPNKNPDFLLKCNTGKEKSPSTLLRRVQENGKRNLKSLGVRTNQHPQQSKATESAASESSITECEETSVNSSQYKCTVCEKTFRRRVSLMQHGKTHMMPDMQRCQSCNKFVSEKDVTYKGKTTSLGYFQCQICVNKSVSQRKTRSHSSSGLSGKLFKCHVCKEMFASMRCLIVHKVKHNVKNQFLCQFCGKAFTYKKSLVVHERIHRYDRKFKCQFCGKAFVQKIQMILHVRRHHTDEKSLESDFHSKRLNMNKQTVIAKDRGRLHTGERPFKCQFCAKRFIAKDHVLSHERIHTGERPFKCQFCAKAFVQKSHCTTHERRHTGERPFKCQFCSKTFITKTHAIRHEKVHAGKRPLKCRFCAKRFLSKNQILQHEKIHVGEKRFRCRFCPKRFVSNYQVLRHERIHTGERPFKCQFCAKGFTEKGHALEHERTHTGEKPFKCQFCARRFIQKSKVTQHEKIHIDKKKHKCSFCSRSFQFNSLRISHERTHTKEKPFKCSFCLKAFSQKSSLTLHEELHKNEKSFKCSFCEKSFVSKLRVTRHEKTHTAERKFKCQFCAKTYPDRYGVNRHERIHTGARPFKCQFCAKTFRLKIRLAEHEKIHTQERPFKCSFCAKRFTQRPHLICHERLHTNEKPFKCSFCDARYAQRSSLTYHEGVHVRQNDIKAKA